MVARDPLSGVQRRVTGYHDFRLDGMADLLLRCRGASILDVACNRGMVGFEFACNGARLVHGVDSYELGITVAREVFADNRSVGSRFEVVDLTQGPAAFDVLQRAEQYDFVIACGIIHKMKRVMPPPALREWITYLGTRTRHYFAGLIGEQDRTMVDECMAVAGLAPVQWSRISELGTSGIWQRPHPDAVPRPFVK